MRPTASTLRGRLVLGAIAVGVAFAVVFGVAATWRLHQVEDRAVRTALLSRLDLARDEVRPDGSLRPDSGGVKTDLVQVLGPDGRVLSASPGLSRVGPLVPLTQVSEAGTSGAEATRALPDPDIDLAALGVPFDLPAGSGALVVAVDAEGFSAARADLMSLLLVGLAAVVIAIAALSWVLAGRALRSVTELTEQAEQVRSGALQQGLSVPSRDSELARLVGALNRMLARLHDGHARELAFAADAGHRLRTPVATLRAEAELALREDDPDERSSALGRILQDVDRLTVIVDRMLARGQRPTAPPTPTREVLDAATVRWTRQAELAEVSLTVTVDEALPPDTVVAQLPDVLEPIADNALRHTPVGGWVSIAARADGPHGCLVVDVTNSGPGVPKDLEDVIFDAWVSSRDASVAGGLGLWLSRETARDAGGDVSLVDPEAGHTTFRATLPTGDASNM